MATKEEMRTWFEGRYERAVDAWFYDTKVTDLQRVAAPVEVQQALREHFPDSAPEEIESLASDLTIEGVWLDVSREKPLGEQGEEGEV